MSNIIKRSTILAAAALLSLGAAATAQSPMAVPFENHPTGPALPEPITWTLIALAATGSGVVAAKRRRAGAAAADEAPDEQPEADTH